MDGVYLVPEGRRYWVIRAESGQYFPHFQGSALIAIGHVDAAFAKIPVKPPGETNWATVHEKLQIEAEKRANTSAYSKRGISSVVAQARSFVDDIKVGDWVVTPGQGALCIGVVTSDAYWSDEQVAHVQPEGKASIMPYTLRRSISWGPVIYRDDFSSPLRRSLMANQAVFNVDEHWEAIYHAIYPAFSRGDYLYISVKITTRHNVSNIDIVSFLSSLSDIELISKKVNELSVDNFDEVLSKSVDDGSLKLATKAEFYSPGDVWGQLLIDVLDGAAKHQYFALVMIAYAALFGNKKLGFDGLLDLDTRHKVRDLILERIKKKGVDKSIERLGARPPRQDTTKLEVTDTGESKKTKKESKK